MRFWRRLPILVPAGVLAACLVGLFLTQGSMARLPFLRSRRGASSQGLVDQRPYQTAQAMAAMAVSAEEKDYARQALRVSDHEVDQAFAQALREASIDARNLTGDALADQQKVQRLQGIVKEDQAKLDQLTAAAKSTAGGNTDDLDVMKAQAQLDKDELDDATEDVARASGDKRGEIQQELTAREAAVKKYDAQTEAEAQTAVASARQYGTLKGRVGAWLDQRTRLDALQQAMEQADSDAKALSAQHADIEKKLSAGASSNGATDSQSKVAKLGRMHSLAQIHGIIDDRTQSQQQLSQVYGRWLNQVKLQHAIVLHMVLQSTAWIAFVVLCSVLGAMAANKMLDRLTMDKRRLHTLRTVTNLTVEFVALLIVLLIVFGVPSQMPTILGLMTAGLTVVFQDFILAFFGWFVLMGKHGIHVGDWVEINGVGGEVVEVSLFRTALLETGNWTDKGHPTGRRVTFINNFAITGQYFNFSTSGQWMWDQITVNVPAGADSSRMIQAVQDAVVKETGKDNKQAQDELQRVMQRHGLSQFSAAPAVDLRPASSGVDLSIRYVTRAGERYDMRNRVYQAVIDLLQKRNEGAVKELTTSRA